MNTHEIERIAAAMHQLRPDWPAASLRTLITKSLADRPRRDVAVALAWIACESGTATPARVLETGPWWKAAAADATFTHGHQQNARIYGTGDGDPREVCSECSMHRSECERRAATNGHSFISRLTAATTPHEHDDECYEVCRRTGLADIFAGQQPEPTADLTATQRPPRALGDRPTSEETSDV